MPKGGMGGAREVSCAGFGALSLCAPGCGEPGSSFAGWMGESSCQLPSLEAPVRVYILAM